MKRKIESAYKRYNANTRDSDVGDCVKRALTVAYSMDYDEVSRELNRISREKGMAWNLYWVFAEFIARRGDAFRAVTPCTAEEFCQEHPSGVYLILVGKSNSGATSHIAAVVNGDLYDSWNSSNWFVQKAATVTSGSSEVFELDSAAIFEELMKFLDSYLEVLNQKVQKDSNMTFSRIDVSKWDKYTGWFFLKCKLGATPDNSKWLSNVTLRHEITIKLNPRLSEEKNISSLKAKLKQKTYDWAYNIHKELVDASASESAEFHPDYRGSRSKLMTFPEWARSRITYFADDGNPEYTDKYTMYMQALPRDPRDPEGEREVTFRADTLRELKGQLEDYKDRFARPDYDY